MAYTKPVSIEYNGNIYSDFSNWTQLYVRVLKILFKENKNILIDLCGKNITGTGRVEIATIDQMDQMIAPKEFADGLYVETNISATDITKKIAGVLSYYKIKVQDFKIYFERKHEQTPSNAVPVKKTKQADSKVFVDADKYRRILLTHYRKGFRLNDKLSVRRFRMQWKSEFDFEVECSDEELCENVMKICIRYGDMAYLPDVMLDEPRRMKLLAYIRKIFSEGKNVIYYESLFKEFSEDFEDGRINNADMLKTYLSHYVADEMYFGKKYIAPDSNVEIDLTEEVRNFLIEADTAVATDEIVSSLSHITRDKVVTVLAGTNSEEFIRNQKGKYFHESIVEFTTDEMIKIVKWINEAIADKEYMQQLFLFYLYSKKKRLYISEAGKVLPFTAMTLTRAVKQLETTDLFLVAKDGVNKFIESKYKRDELFEKAKVYLTTPVRKAGYIDKTQVTENMVFAGETVLSEKTMLNPSRVVTYAISEKDYDKTLLTDELIDPDKQIRLELWAYNPKQFSEDNSADDISIVLSFADTNDERIEEAVDELQERRLKE